MIAARVARRLARKVIKPVALWLTVRALARAEDQADFLMHLRTASVPMEIKERKRAVQLVERRNQIAGW